MPKRPKIAPSASLSPDDAQIKPTTQAKRFSFGDPKWGAIQNDLYQTFQAAMDARQDKLDDLAIFNAMYEMEHDGDPDQPWVGASDVIPPLHPAYAEAVRDYIIMSVFTPRLFLASTPIVEEQKYLPAFEKWVNSLLTKERFTGESWYETLISVIQASGRDGTAGILATWMKRERDIPNFTWTEKVGADGTLVLDDVGLPAKERVLKTVHEVIKEPHVQLVQSKDVYLVPAESKNFQSTLCSCITLWLTEEQLLQIADGMGDDPEKGVFSREALEIVFNYNPQGQTDVPTDPEGDFDKDEGGQIDTSIGQGTNTSDNFKNRGPFEIRLMMSVQHDMNNDGRVERNWFWLHDRSYTLIGWMPYEYLMDRWPAEFFSMYPRIGQFDGYSIHERIADSVDSQTANKNQRINYQDLISNPWLVHKSGADFRNKNMANGGPGTRVEADDPQNDFRYLMPPPLTGTTFQEDSQDDQNIARVLGMSAPFVGGQGPTRQTATQAKQAALAQTTRSSTIALFYRFFLRRFIALILALYRQFADEDFQPPELLGQDKTPQEILMMHWTVEPAKLSDPVDADQRGQQMAIWTEQMMKIYPTRFSQPEAQRELAVAYTEQAFPGLANTETIIGTADQAKQLGDALRQAQAQQMQQQGQKGGQ